MIQAKKKNHGVAVSVDDLTAPLMVRVTAIRSASVCKARGDGCG